MSASPDGHYRQSETVLQREANRGTLIISIDLRVDAGIYFSTLRSEGCKRGEICLLSNSAIASHRISVSLGVRLGEKNNSLHNPQL